MSSPARRHLEEHMARAAAAANAPLGKTVAPPVANGGRAGQEYRLMLVALGEDLRALSNIQSLERKIDAKRGMIGRYDAWVDGALSAGTATQDDIVATMLVWSIDLGLWGRSLAIAAHMLRHHVQMPERYRRTAPTLIAEEVAEAALAPGGTVPLATLQATDALTSGADMPDEVRAKLNKALGAAFRAAADAFDPEADSAVAGGRPALLNSALRHYTRALGLDAKCGVKGQVNQLQKQLAALPKANAAATEDEDA